MTIDKELLLVGKTVYNKRLDKFGYISSLELQYGFGGCYIQYKVFYDTFNDNLSLFVEDFKKNKVQFVIIDFPELGEAGDEYNERQIEDIKEFFEDDFSEDMIIYVTEDEKKANDDKNKKRNTLMLHTDLVDLTDVSNEVFADDFYSRELYKSYKDGVLTKEEMMFAIINHLSQELKRVSDSNFDYFIKYELTTSMEDIINDEET